MLLFACENNTSNVQRDFYSYYMIEDDVWRLPLIKPYQLISAYCCTEWTIDSNLKKFIIYDISPDSIAYDKGFIIFANKAYSGGKWVIFNINDSAVYKYDNYSTLTDEMDSLGINPNINMESIENIFLKWKKDGDLPWYRKE